jgi:hypothetical protein
MHPSELTPQDFNRYPPLARHLAVSYIALIKRLPLVLLTILLREMLAYDWKFPVEQRDLENQLRYLGTLSEGALRESVSSFAQLKISAGLEQRDWLNSPVQFVEELTADLWTTQQVDSFRKAAEDYVARQRTVVPEESPVTSRLAIVIIGQGVQGQHSALFRKVRPHGVYFTQLKPQNGLEILISAAAERARAYPSLYGHWYIEGGDVVQEGEGLTNISYAALDPVRTRLLQKISAAIQSGNAGPEAVRSMLAALHPDDLGMDEGGTDAAVLNHFKMSLFTEGSGTQIFSTTFVQWSAREVLRRAQPLTVLVRFAPRVRDRPMDELLAGIERVPALDPEGSLVDADTGAYYTWINLQRLPGADRSSFLVWFEDHNEAVAIAPSLPRGTQSSANADLAQVLKWMS